MADFEDFRDLYELGQTPAQIAATLAADPRYKRNTDSGVLMNMIKNTFPVIRKDALGGSGNWEGPLIDAAKALDLADPDPTTAAVNNLVYAGLEQLLSNETPTVVIACHDKPLIGQMTTAICQLVGQIVASTDQIEGDADTVKAAVVAQTGGLLYGDVTEAEISEAIETFQKEEIASAAVNPLQAKVNAMSSWLTTPNNLQLSVADYQALADELLASPDGNPTGGE